MVYWPLWVDNLLHVGTCTLLEGARQTPDNLIVTGTHDLPVKKNEWQGTCYVMDPKLHNSITPSIQFKIFLSNIQCFQKWLHKQGMSQDAKGNINETYCS